MLADQNTYIKMNFSIGNNENSDAKNIHVKIINTKCKVKIKQNIVASNFEWAQALCAIVTWVRLF